MLALSSSRKFTLDRLRTHDMPGAVSLPALFQQALAHAIPESRAWRSDVSDRSYSVALQWPVTSDRRALNIDLHDGEIDITFCLGAAGVGRGPCELNQTISEANAEEALTELADFLASFFREDVALVMRRGWIGGGRDFVDVRGLTPDVRKQFQWIASWNGTYDSAVPQ